MRLSCRINQMSAISLILPFPSKFVIVPLQNAADNLLALLLLRTT